VTTPLPQPGQTGFYAQTREAKKILVVDLGFLGDTLHLIPALWEIKRNYPQASVHVLTSPVGAEVLTLAPCADRAWAIEMMPDKRTLGQQWRVLRALRREGFDVAFNFSGADRSIFMTAFSGARWKLAHEAQRTHFWNPWLIPRWIPRRSTDLPVFEQRRAVLEACGLKLTSPRFDLRVPGDATAWAVTHVLAGAVHLSPNASVWYKEWPLPNSIELARHLLAEQPQLQIVATAGSSAREQARLKELVSAIANPRLLTFTALTVPQLAALLTRCFAHVGADSGVLHLAVALGLPTVSIFRDYPGLKEWLPRGPQHRHLTVPCPCATQMRESCSSVQIARCLAEISPASVAARLQTTTAAKMASKARQ
jgi:ADP-heptose:LPS heptosyltransferase